jgi:hypothetical protein
VAGLRNHEIMKIDLANPPELERCDRCGKVAGRFKGYYGAECQCDRPPAQLGRRSFSRNAPAGLNFGPTSFRPSLPLQRRSRP